SAIKPVQNDQSRKPCVPYSRDCYSGTPAHLRNERGGKVRRQRSCHAVIFSGATRNFPIRSYVRGLERSLRDGSRLHAHTSLPACHRKPSDPCRALNHAEFLSG